MMKMNKEIENKFKDYEERVKMLEEGISDEIDNLTDELKKIKKRNIFLEERDKDFQRTFKEDREIFKNQLREIKELKKKLNTITYTKLKEWVNEKDPLNELFVITISVKDLHKLMKEKFEVVPETEGGKNEKH